MPGLPTPHWRPTLILLLSPLQVLASEERDVVGWLALGTLSSLAPAFADRLLPERVYRRCARFGCLACLRVPRPLLHMCAACTMRSRRSQPLQCQSARSHVLMSTQCVRASRLLCRWRIPIQIADNVLQVRVCSFHSSNTPLGAAPACFRCSTHLRLHPPCLPAHPPTPPTSLTCTPCLAQVLLGCYAHHRIYPSPANGQPSAFQARAAGEEWGVP